MVGKVLYILGERRRSLVLLLLIFVLSSFLELVGIGAMFPYLAIISNPAGGESHGPLGWIHARARGIPHEQLVVILSLMLVGVYVLKNGFLLVAQYAMYRYLQSIQRSVKLKLFRAYLHAPFRFHLRMNSAVLINNAVHETICFTDGPLMGMLMLAAEAIFLLFITAALLLVSPLAVLVVVVFGLFVWLFHRMTRQKTEKYGRTRMEVNARLVKAIMEGLNNLKLTRLLGAESYFVRKAEAYSRPMALFCARFSTMLVAPRLMVEVLVVSLLGGMVVVLVETGHDLVAMLPTLGVLGAAAIRVMPSASRIINGLSMFVNAACVIDRVHGNLKEIEAYEHEQEGAATGEPVTFDRAIALEGVTFRYPTSPRPVLESVDLVIRKGQSVGLIGRSGSGKSTLVDVLLGLLHPDRGQVTVDGRPVAGNLPGWRARLGYVPQHIHLTDDTLRRNIAFGVEDGAIDEAALEASIRAAALDEMVGELPDGLDTVIGEEGIRLSGGQRQRVGIARALYRNPDVLIFDEATSSLDLETEKAVTDAVRSLKGKKTMMIVAHRMSTVAPCDVVFKMEGGRIVASGVFEEVVA